MSDLPNTENYSVIALSIAWDFAKTVTLRGSHTTEKEYLDGLLKNFIKARKVVEDQEDVDKAGK